MYELTNEMHELKLATLILKERKKKKLFFVNCNRVSRAKEAGG